MEKCIIIVAKTAASRIYVEAPQNKQKHGTEKQTYTQNTKSDNESWQNSEDEICRHIDVVNIISLSFRSIRSSIIRELETSSG